MSKYCNYLSIFRNESFIAFNYKLYFLKQILTQTILFMNIRVLFTLVIVKIHEFDRNGVDASNILPGYQTGILIHVELLLTSKNY